MPTAFQPTVYLLASGYNGTLYAGVTSNLLQRLAQHRASTFAGFSKKYDVHRLVWFEQQATMELAILQEKRIKKWRRAWKIGLIEERNPEWHDLSLDFGFDPL